MAPNPLPTLEEAVSEIESGSSVAAGLALEHAIPFAVGHELLRQGTDDLTMIGPISDLLFDQLIGGGAVSGIRAAWVGNVSAGTGYRFREAVENDRIRVENHSNFSIALALKAGAMGVPYLPTRSLLGSDIFEESDLFARAEDPFTGDEVVQVPAVNPDWTVVHAQRASPEGDVHMWGNTGITDPAVGAAENVLVTTEEVVDSETIKSDPSRTAITREQVTAVVECPFGAHPSPLTGHYNRDNEYYLDYHSQTDTQEAFDEWADEWVYGVENRDEYMELVDADLSITEPTVAAEVEYGQ
ncbi:CoA-transferase [Halostella sp. PRR32]|uniref:CoA transferase subunit A n=1 Tax=Halostella sp. PRR32 TaxID=3098147 RepID=UPI002B1D7B6E|nr:CoA-transferase [Halostella sp. PRR32]